MRGDQRVNCMLEVFLLGRGVLVLLCKHTALDGYAVHSHPEQCAQADREEDCYD
ncbi:unnamed protein product [Staurois parvus]|uniref:Uncharacterized protein n=1 Tax=Staurois parvus TaxID=386267 RepID=A0ABN9CAZ0_9NEOB|nr:unnamed protein product [Staurois parvus]